jgi:D-alanyl-D-alanine carboxypeptidase
MMRFDRLLDAVIEGATTEARADGSPTVEAHHLLLAIAAADEPGTGRVLRSVGLDRATIRAALDREFERSLAAAGVSVGAAAPHPSSRRHETPRLGASFRRAMERGLGSSGTAGPRPLHLLLGIVAAPVGTVARVLALAGIDRDDCVRRIRDALAAESEVAVGGPGR